LQDHLLQIGGLGGLSNNFGLTLDIIWILCALCHMEEEKCEDFSTQG